MASGSSGAARKYEYTDDLAAGGGSGPTPPGPPPDAKLYLLTNSLLTQVEIRKGKLVQRGILLNINTEDGTVDVQCDSGLIQHVPKYDYEHQTLADGGISWCWHWIGAPPPEKP